MTDPIADMLTRIRNAVAAKQSRVDIPASKLKVEIARILQDEGYIQGFKVVEETPEGATTPQKFVRIFLKYGPRGERVITGIERISRPGRRVYFGARRRAGGAGRARHQHPDDLARRDDRARGASRRASAAKCSATCGRDELSGSG